MTTKYFLLSIFIILRITVSCQNTTAFQMESSTVTQTIFAQIFSNLSTTPLSSSLNQNLSMRNETVTPPATNNITVSNETMTTSSMNNITLRNETVTPPATNNITLRNETVTPPATNNITLRNETVTPPATNNITVSNETMTTSSINNITLKNETVTPPTTNNITLRNETVTPPATNNITVSNETMTTSSMNNITLRNETVTPPATNTITLSNETMTTSSSNMTTRNDITMNQTTIIYDLPGGTDEPARPGEYSSKVKMGCKFKQKYNQKYKDKSSKEYIDFSNEIFFKMRLNLKKYYRLIMIIFISIDGDDNEMSITMEFVLASTTLVSTNELSANVRTASTAAYGSSITISNVDVTQESAIVQSTTTSPTTTISSTITSTTIVYDLPGGTDEPARQGEYSSKVEMGCSFTKRNFHANFKNKASSEYMDFTNEIFFIMRWNLRRYLRLIRLIFLSLDQGSVIAKMELSLASNTSVSNANLSNFVQSAAMAGFVNSISISSFTVTQESTLVTPTTTSSPNTFPGWGIFLIILACVVVITAVILLTIFGLKYEHSRSRNLDPYLEDTPNDKKGILLQRARMYDSM